MFTRRVPTRVTLTMALVAIVAVACSNGSDENDPDTEVLGIQVERDEDDPSETATSTPTPTPTGEPSTSTSEPEPSESPSAAPTAAATTPPSPASPSPGPPSPDPSPASDPSPTSEPEPEPIVLGDVEGDRFSTWQPYTEDPEDCCWIELGGGTQTRDDTSGAESVRGRLHDPVPGTAEQEPWQRRVRQATCQAWLQAPEDRGLVARGTFVVRVSYGETVVIDASYAVDVTLEPGERHDLPLPDPVEVDADDGLQVNCSTRFDA